MCLKYLHDATDSKTFVMQDVVGTVAKQSFDVYLPFCRHPL